MINLRKNTQLYIAQITSKKKCLNTGFFFFILRGGGGGGERRKATRKEKLLLNHEAIPMHRYHEINEKRKWNKDIS
jgi:hypothetical protein